jgi:hypothetical protein
MLLLIGQPVCFLLLWAICRSLMSLTRYIDRYTYLIFPQGLDRVTIENNRGMRQYRVFYLFNLAVCGQTVVRSIHVHF